MNLNDAITAVETADAAFQKSVSQTTADQGMVQGIQDKLTAAQAVITQDNAAQDDARKARNAALQAAIAEFQAEIIPDTPTPTPAP